MTLACARLDRREPAAAAPPSPAEVPNAAAPAPGSSVGEIEVGGQQETVSRMSDLADRA